MPDAREVRVLGFDCTFHFPMEDGADDTAHDSIAAEIEQQEFMHPFVQSVFTAIQKFCSKGTFQRERGRNGKKAVHVQARIKTNERSRSAQVANLLKKLITPEIKMITVTKTVGTVYVLDDTRYVTKTETRIAGPWSIEDVATYQDVNDPSVGRNLYGFQNFVYEMTQHIMERYTVLLYDPTGSYGKSFIINLLSSLGWLQKMSMHTNPKVLEQDLCSAMCQYKKKNKQFYGPHCMALDVPRDFVFESIKDERFKGKSRNAQDFVDASAIFVGIEAIRDRHIVDTRHNHQTFVIPYGTPLILASNSIPDPFAMTADRLIMITITSDHNAFWLERDHVLRLRHAVDSALLRVPADKRYTQEGATARVKAAVSMIKKLAAEKPEHVIKYESPKQAKDIKKAPLRTITTRKNEYKFPHPIQERLEAERRSALGNRKRSHTDDDS